MNYSTVSVRLTEEEKKTLEEFAKDRDIVRIKADCEQDLWYALSIDYYDEQTKYYMFGSFGYMFDPSDYSGILIELNDIKDEG